MKYRHSGYTLLEVMFSLGLLTVMALCLLSLFVTSSTASEEGAAFAQVTAVAAGQLNRCKCLPYNTLLGYLTTPMAPYNVTDSGVDYHIELTVTRVGSNSAAADYALLDLRLQASWLQRQALHEGGASQATKQLAIHSVVGPSSSY